MVRLWRAANRSRGGCWSRGKSQRCPRRGRVRGDRRARRHLERQKRRGGVGVAARGASDPAVSTAGSAVLVLQLLLLLRRFCRDHGWEGGR